MENITAYLPDLLRLVKRRYPDWESFSDPAFIEDEEGYKVVTRYKVSWNLDRPES